MEEQYYKICDCSKETGKINYNGVPLAKKRGWGREKGGELSLKVVVRMPIQELFPFTAIK